jgi:hypothetical protein
MCKKYINNLETGHIELHFKKEEYLSMLLEKKKLLGRAYRWCPSIKAWISRSTKNHYFAIEVAKKLGFKDYETVGKRLSYEEQLIRKAEKAERRAERYEQKAENAANRGEQLQSGLNSYKGDIAFFTQPIIPGHKGCESFGRRREKLFDRYRKGFDEYRKSNYFSSKADACRSTARLSKFSNKPYLYNRIEECEKNIRAFKRNIEKAEKMQNDIYLNNLLDKFEQEMDKLAFLKNKLEELGGIEYNNKNIKIGYLVKIRGSWCKVTKANKKSLDTIITEGGAKGFPGRSNYAEIEELKIPEDCVEVKEFKNPFRIGNIFIKCSINGNLICYAYQVVKVTARTVVLQQIKVKENEPMYDMFISKEKHNKRVIVDCKGNYIVKGLYFYV